ncbi:hypothetical protein CTAM01_09601 [Colletotrichum tamarilloi]|uniref:Uncharacterized protein n=1 Tax=Colletotrichum tamarilloi TaxID=1209934 RepID=A0ABQ9R370_9PEZI|nr:uncharacterized protein CTAM01_09601 [Colletotrichum tamarilloi]KAI3544282.1 hypothetical protein CSPX01_05734 [Colletotrichum filicis]KAK1492974.1 hypothetical protein CTAM01_09601 [Colletotrichum tamarilloi]
MYPEYLLFSLTAWTSTSYLLRCAQQQHFDMFAAFLNFLQPVQSQSTTVIHTAAERSR